MNEKTVKILGVVATVAGVGITALSNWVGEKQQDEKIAKKVAEALAKASEEES